MKINSKRQRKARIEHTCHVCSEKIVPGAEYIHETSNETGIAISRDRHIHCDALMQEHILRYGDPESEEEIMRTLWADCCGETCSLERRTDCMKEPYRVFLCEICQKKMLSPVIANIAIQSVRDNADPWR